jgi:2-C-methyl-D-erythritol 2,4-cyclodiphosphate synthase
MGMRIGQGVDVHAFSEDREFILCGVSIPAERGLLGHSDADVAVHAVMDSVLGALALGDIGNWFPDTSEAYKDANSLELLSIILKSSQLEGWSLGNLDLTIVAQQPKLSPFIQKMRDNLATVFGTSREFISIKATTTEKLGFCGREEGILATAIILLEKVAK